MATDRNRSRARALAAIPDGRPARSALAGLVPSRRSLLAAAGLLAAAVAAYLAAWKTPLFAVQTVEIRGAKGREAAAVRNALAPLLGSSLVAMEPGSVERRLARVPLVAEARYDRAFPHTLRVFVEVERPLAVLRRGADSWLVSARGRVVQRLGQKRLPRLPRIWLPRATQVAVGSVVSTDARQAVKALAPLLGTTFLRRVVFVRAAPGELTLAVRSGVELRLGTLDRLALKLQVAKQLVPPVERGALPAYIDLTAPERPVAGRLYPQVAG